MRIAAPIRKGPSVPQDSSTPSFLTILPPEIRNAIYEYAFVLHDELVIIDAYEYTRQPVWEEEFDDLDSEEDSADVERIQEHAFAVRDVRLPMSLLRTCRQVYHEAASILYGRQKIRITVAPHRHNGSFRQLRTAVRWLQSIGSQYKLLTRLVIDTSALCPDECDIAGRTNCAPILKALWLRPGLESRVEYTRSGIEIDKRVHEPYLGLSFLESTSASIVGEIIADLSTKDELGLRRYAGFGRLIRSIWVDGDDQYGIVNFASPADILHYHEDKNAYEVGVSSRDFVRSSNDGRLVWGPTREQKSSRLKQLPGTILKTIMRYTVPGTLDFIVFDLDD